MLTPDLHLPRYRNRGLDSVLPFAARIIGHPVREQTSGEAQWQAPILTELNASTPVRRAVVVLIDGLGYELLRERSGHAPFLRSQLERAQVLTTGFPSTTATSLGSFGSGTTPGQTSMLGYSILEPATGEIANLVSWQGVETSLQPHPTVFESLAEQGITSANVGLARFAESGLTGAALRGAKYVDCNTVSDRVDTALAALRDSSLVYLYWGEVDKAGHQYGWRSEQWSAQLEVVDGNLRDLDRRLPKDTALLITADHGMVDVAPQQAWEVTEHPALLQDVALISGEPRASHLHLTSGSDPEQVAVRWQETLQDTALVLTRNAAITGGLFGPEVSELSRRILGDLVVLARKQAVILDARTQTPAARSLPGVHGSLTSAEALVPLIVTR